MAHVFYKPHKKNNSPKHFIDKLIYPIAVIAPIMTIPQLVQIIVSKKVQGISITTWGAYATVSALWVIYGLIHKEKPIILTNVLLFILDFLIVVGVLLYR